MNFFESYYRAAQKLPDDERMKLYDKIFAFYFDSDDSELEGIAGAVWEGIKPNVSNSKKKSENGKKGGAPKDNQNASKIQVNDKQKSSKIQANDKQNSSDKEKEKDKNKKEKEKEKEKNETASSLIESYAFPPSVTSVIKDWVKYKIEKRQGYKPTGLRNLLTQIRGKVEELGEAEVIEVITLSMSQNWQGIVWEKAKGAKHDNLQRPTKGWGKDYDVYQGFRESGSGG